MNRRGKLIVSITGIFIILLALVGLTYAYFLTRIRGNENDKSISVTTANLELVYGDGNNLVTAGNIEPGDPITPKTFRVTNNGNATVEDFNIYLEDVRNGLSRKTDMIYTVTCENTTVGAESSKCEDFEVVENEKNGTELVFPSVVSVIAKDTLDPATETTNAEQHTYTITVTYKEMNVDQSEDMNKEVSAKVNIYDSKTKFLASEIMKNVKSATETKYVEPSMLGIEENTTLPAHSINLETEKILTYTMDDYGTSYYFRGNVDDNYVNFAGMCWKIVRIEGDGSVKLILEDRYAECNDRETEKTSEIFTGNWSSHNGDISSIEDSPPGRDVTFGYNDSNLRTDFINFVEDNGLANSSKSFQTEFLTDYLDKLKVDEWCYDDTIIRIDSDNEYYGAYTRIIENKTPSLKCTGNKLTKFIDNTDMYVGTLTADEMTFAGLYNSTNYSNYLINNISKDKLFWWSLTPSNYSSMIQADGIFLMSWDGSLHDYFVCANTAYLRPVITLKSIVTINKLENSIENEGSVNNPYVVE